MIILISKLTESTDYNNLLKNIELTYGSFWINKKPVNFKYSIDPFFLLINGGDIIKFKEGKNFLKYFRNSQSDILDENGNNAGNWLIYSIINNCLNEIHSSLFSGLSQKNKVDIYIHWGGAGKINATNRLNSFFENNNLQFKAHYFTSTESENYEKFVEGNLKDIYKTIDTIKEESEENKKKIYELMEEIYISNFDKIINSQDKIPIIIKNDNIYYSRMNKINILLKEEYNIILENDVISVENEKIEIKDINRFRNEFNNILNKIPGEIYKIDI